MYRQRIEKVLKKCLTKCPHGYLTCRSDIGRLTSVRKHLIMLLCFVAPRLIQDAMFITIKKHPPDGSYPQVGAFYYLSIYRSIVRKISRCFRFTLLSDRPSLSPINRKSCLSM